MIGNIQFIYQKTNETKNVTVNGYHLKHRARKTIIATKRIYKIIKINKVSIILESEAEKHVINIYLKMKTPIMWRNFLKNFAENRDYIYNYCSNPYRKFHRYCVDWYMYNRIKKHCYE